MHTVITSAASVADKHMLPDLLRGEERKVWGDGAYQGQTEAIHAAAPKAQDMTCRRTRYKNYVDEEAKCKNTAKVRVRATVEHLSASSNGSSDLPRCATGVPGRTTSGCGRPSRW